MNYKNLENEIKTDWFKDHVAKFEKLNDRVSTLSWGKPKSSFYYTRYVFDSCKLYVSGDMGEAVFCLTEKASIESIKDYDIHYFHKKLAAFSEDKYSFDSAAAIARLKEEIGDAKENKDVDDEGIEYKTERNEMIDKHIGILNGLIDESECCCNKSNWDYVVNQVYYDLTDYDCDVHEWIYKAGDVIPSRVQGYLIGIKMAYEQLNAKQED